MKNVRNAFLFRKIRGERPRGILGCRWKDRCNIKMVLNGVCPDYVDWIAVARIG